MKRYFICYKPYLVLSQFTTRLDKLTLANFFDVPKNIYPVGRLDEDSEGLLILSDDKKLNHRLLDPSFHHKREYWVQVEGIIVQQAIDQLQQGVEINVDGKHYITKQSIVSIFNEAPLLPQRDPPIRARKNISTTWIKIILSEGKNRQVRKMTAKVGFPTLRLIRYRIEDLALNELQPGEMIELSKGTIYKKLFHE
jgi:23S rRNA pseudouridine2457 synthase